MVARRRRSYHPFDLAAADRSTDGQIYASDADLLRNWAVTHSSVRVCPDASDWMGIDCGQVIGSSLVSVLGDFIRLRREELSLDQTHLAGCVGVHQQTVSKWEQGKAIPRPKRIRRLAEALEVDLANLMRYAGYLTEAEPSDAKGEEPFHRFMAQISELTDDQLIVLIDYAWEEHRSRAGFTLDTPPRRRKPRC